MMSLKMTPEVVLCPPLHTYPHTHEHVCTHTHTHFQKESLAIFVYDIQCMYKVYIFMVCHICGVHLYQYIITHTIFASQLHHYPAAPWPGSANIYSPPCEWYCSQPPPEMVHLNFKGQSSFYLKRTACIYACAHSVFVFCGDTLGCTH